jgi:hypothetical protein
MQGDKDNGARKIDGDDSVIERAKQSYIKRKYQKKAYKT